MTAFRIIATLEDLDEASLKLILNPAQERAGGAVSAAVQMEGVDLTVAAEELDAIARKAIDRETGARGLRSVMEAILVIPGNHIRG